MGDRRGEGVAYLPAFLVRAADDGLLGDLPWCHEADGTMVMADLSGFTALSERLARLGDEGAERLTGIIYAFFERMLKTASRHGGDTLTFGGDAILLLFEGRQHAARAAVAALEMLRQVERAGAVETDRGKVKIGMSVGAHSDRFVLAGVGLADERAHLVVVGRGGELTALAEAQAECGQLAVSTACREMLPAGSSFAPAGDFWLVEGLGACALPRPSLEPPALTEQELRRLGPFLPPYVQAADRCANGERRQTPGDGEGPVRLAPERRRAVMVFVDVLGLSEIIDHLGLEAAVGQLQAYTAMLARLAAKHSGFVVSSDIATKGSKLIVTFGAPMAHEYAPANAARFALELSAGLRDSGLDLQHKIGVNGGHVFAGEVGPPFRRQYTVMGDAVNLAARLMVAAELDQALISRGLLSYVSYDLCARELPPITVKGKEKPVAVCVLEEEGRTGGQIRGGIDRDRRQGHLFGRRAELERLARAWELAREGRGQTVLIEGEPGVGKTRLLDEALRAIAASGRVVRTACFEHLQAAPFAPWLGVLHGVCGTSPDDPKERRTRAVRAYLRRHLPDWLEFGSLLDPVLNVGLPQSPVVVSLEARPRREKLVELAAQVALSAAESGPCAIVLEDLHWADDSSRELLAYLVGHAGEASVLLLLTARPSEAADGLVGAEVARVMLAELSQSESLAMMREALDVADFPAEIGEAIYAKTKGNPLFLEEVVHSLRQPGVLERILSASSVTRAAELATLEIPDRVQGLLMSRIDRLPAEAREVLKAGAVVGPSFDRRLLGALEDTLLASVPLDRAFDELLSAALVVPADDAASVSFRHALVQDVAYDSLPFARRRDLHGRVARCLESLQGPVDHGVLVHHYSRAGDGAKTRVHAVKASEDSIAVYAHREAVDYLDIALGTVRGRSPIDACLRSRFEELEGGCLQTFGRHDEAILQLLSSRRRWASAAVRRTAGAALRDVAPIDDADARDSLLCWKAAVSMQRGPAAYKRAIRWLDMAASALPAPRAGLAAKILISKSGSLVRLGRYHEALGLLDEALALARGEDDPVLTGYGNAIRCLALSQLGRCREAVVAGQDSISAYERAGDLSGEALARMNPGMAYQFVDSPREGLEHMELSLAICVRLGHKSGMEQMHHNIGAVLLQLGEMDEGIRHLQQTIAAWGTAGCPPLQVG